MKREHISVRTLVEFLIRRGDIDNRTGRGADAEAMQMGARMHRKIQAGMGASYHAEVPLKLAVDYREEPFGLLLEGRADGIIDALQEEGGEITPVMVDEIKGVFLNLEHLTEPVPVHLAQAKVYAFMYAWQEYEAQDLFVCPVPEEGTADPKDAACADQTGTAAANPDGAAGMQTEHCMAVRMTYVNLESEETRYFTFRYTLQELRTWFTELLSDYYRWAKFKYEWTKKRNASAKQVPFPFAYRNGQKEVAAAVYRTIDREKQLFLMAPTGVGKTIATVYPSVKAIGSEKAEMIFYLTAKTMTRTVAQKAFRALEEEGLCMKVLTLTAKDKICFMEERTCNPDDCPYAKGHLDRVNDAVYDLLVHEDACDREKIETYAQAHRVCPFEMMLDLSCWVDALICDYNYLFDPNAHLRRFFSDGVKGSYIFLIDEAHNLVDRGRKMYSASLRKEDFLEVRRKIGALDPNLTRMLSRCNSALLAYKRECEDYLVLDSVSGLIPPLLGLMGAMEEFFEELHDEELRKDLLEFYFSVRDFLYIYDLTDENYVLYSRLQEDGFFINLFCVNPARNLDAFLRKGVGTVFFSATFLPIRYYKKLLSVREDDYAVYAKSPFPSDNRLVLTGEGVSTKYTLRGPVMYEKYADYLLEGVLSKPGNYMAFFPSYRMLEEVHACFVRCLTERSEKMPPDGETDRNVAVMLQLPGMKEAEREAFLTAFEKPPVSGSRIGFCVMGGIFAEGIDLTDDSLIGAFVIGTGLPQVCCERELLKQYFDAQGENGFEYAYLFAGMNRVLQAAGRVIRTETDRGVVMLLDDRFMRREYRDMFPREWDSVRCVKSGQLKEVLRMFWEQGTEDIQKQKQSLEN